MPQVPTLARAGLVLVTAVCVLAACQTVSEGFKDVKSTLTSANLAFVEIHPGGPALPPAPLPAFGVGDGFAFDNGRTYTVAAVDGSRITWNAGTDYHYVSRRNFVLPILSWSWTHPDGRVTSGTSAPGAPPDVLWPLKVGNRTAYYSRDTYDNGKGKVSSYQEEWKCWVAGTEAVTVPAGTFNTFEIICDRSEDNYWAQRTHWFYAPAAGYYVRRVLEFPNAKQQKMNLVAYGPRPVALPPAAERLRVSTVQRALEKALSRHTVTARGGGYVVAVTPMRTVRMPSGLFCRDYRQQISARGRTSLQQGRACRDRDGVWRSR